jgi:hypothetical protein
MEMNVEKMKIHLVIIFDSPILYLASKIKKFFKNEKCD